MNIEQLKRDREAGTPGLWRWFGNARNNDLYLATERMGHRYVMGFERWGMQGAQPRFQPGSNGLVPASDLLIFEVGDPQVRGYEQARGDESVYRYDIAGVDCADARRIARLPELEEAFLEALALLERYAAGIGFSEIEGGGADCREFLDRLK